MMLDCTVYSEQLAGLISTVDFVTITAVDGISLTWPPMIDEVCALLRSSHTSILFVSQLSWSQVYHSL